MQWIFLYLIYISAKKKKLNKYLQWTLENVRTTREILLYKLLSSLFEYHRPCMYRCPSDGSAGKLT